MVKKEQLLFEDSKPASVFSLRNVVIAVVLLLLVAAGYLFFTSGITPEKLTDIAQNPNSLNANPTDDSGPYAPKLKDGEFGKKITISAEDINGASGGAGSAGGVSGGASVELTPSGPKYTYDVKNDEELQVLLAALFFHGRYAFPDSENITITVNFQDKPSKTFTIPASTIETTRDEHTNFTQFYDNVTIT